jgi:hypothetical protein
VKIFGFAGKINSGKNLAASMVPGAVILEWSDPIYEMLSIALRIPADVLKQRDAKERPMKVRGMDIIVRHGLRTLGHEWGREQMHTDFWVTHMESRIRDYQFHAQAEVFAIPGTRYMNEVRSIRNLGGKVFWVDRPGLPEPARHPSDNSIRAEDCDAILVNAGCVDDLRAAVLAACA